MMDAFNTPRTFQAQPSRLKKQIFLTAGLLGAAAIPYAFLTRGQSEYGAPAFGGGITALAFSLRFYLMQVRKGPAALTFAEEGVTLSNESSQKTVPWSDLKCIRYMISGGHHWEIHSRTQDATLDFYLDGFTGRQREDLHATISSISMPGVKIIPYYNPFEEAA